MRSCQQLSLEYVQPDTLERRQTTGEHAGQYYVYILKGRADQVLQDCHTATLICTVQATA